MAVPDDIFTKLPPVPYDQARNQIRNGDIALFSGNEGLSPIIEHFTHSPFSHVGFILRMDDIDRIMLLESVEHVGVRMLPLSTKVNGGQVGKPYTGKLLVCRHEDFPEPGPDFNAKFNEMTRFAVDRLGCPYNVEDISLIGAKVAAAMAGLHLPGNLVPGNAYICSEYADICYEKIGIKIGRESPEFVSPGDFGRDPKVRAVVSITPDKRM